jgi:glucose-6-phosphate 1-dehydrogenase
VTPIIEQWHEWDREGTPDSDICFYEAGGWGPEAADELIERDGRRWRRL